MITKGTTIRPGDISEFKVVVESSTKGEIEISNAVGKILIFQDILAPFWTGVVAINDTSNMISTIPFEQGMKLSLTWGTEFKIPSDCRGTKTIEFHIYGIENRQHINGNLTTYSILVATKEYFKNKTQRIYGRLPKQRIDSLKPTNEYPEKLITNIVKTYIGNEYSVVSPFTGSRTSFKSFSLNANNWSPFITTSFLSKLTLVDNGGKRKTADFLLFKSDTAEFKFQSIESMFTDKVYSTGLTFIQKPVNYKDENGNDSEEMLNIIDFNVHHFDVDVNFNSGMQASRVLSFDVINKTIKFSDFKLGDDVQKDSIQDIKKTSLIDNESNYNANIIFQPVHNGVGTGDINELHDDWIASRRSSLVKLEENKLTWQLHGSICSWQWLGKTCTVRFPKLEDHTDGTKDETFSGTYLVTNIVHDIDKIAYRINVTGAKKRLNE
jgi:hypothetical protein